MNLPNKITTARVFMIPLFLIVYLSSIPYSNIIAGIIFIIASLSDTLDGYIARKHNLVTNFGKLIDPLADKLLVISALICLVEKGLLTSWFVIIIIGREFIISGFRLVAVETGTVIAASPWGKLKTIFQMVMCILLIFNFNNIVFNVAEQIFMYGALVLTIISLVDYIYKNKEIVKNMGM